MIALTLALLTAAPAAPAAEPSSSQVNVVELLGESIPAGLPFTDSTGREVTLESLYQPGRPVILSLVYYRCPTLCDLVSTGLVDALGKTGLRLGEDYAVATVSVDPSEPVALAAEKKRGFLQALGRPPDDPSWAFLVGKDESISALAKGVGFQYTYDASLRQFAHAAALVVLTPTGKISRYVYGVRYGAREMRLALVEAAGGKVGTAFDRFLLLCTKLEGAAQRHGAFVRGFLQGGALLVLAALGGLLAVLWRRELKGQRDAARGAR